jgi:hypothetical protein
VIARIARKVWVQQVARIDVEREREALNVLNRQVAQPPFDGADVSSIQRGPIGQLLLGDAASHAHQSNIPREEILKVLRVRDTGVSGCRLARWRGRRMAVFGFGSSSW